MGPDPDWVDFNKIQIPQADEQQRLLANLIQHVNRDQMPLPRFWYFPRGEKAVVVMTGDDHANNGTAGQFDWDIAQSPPGCNVDNWECVRGTSYVYPNTPLSNTAAAAYEAQGFEVALHVNTNCADWTPASLAGFYDDQLPTFAAAYPGVPTPSTNRTHCITWSDWATQPKVEAARGIRLDTNYYYWPAAWVQNRPGYFTGSGMPMRFADLDGSMIDAYQAATQMPDESGLDYALHINTLLDNAIGAEGYYGVVTTNMHTDTGPHPGQQTVVNAALAKGVPVVSARQMLTWLDGRNGSSFANLAWSSGTLTFSIARGAGSNGLQAMLPTQGANGSLQTLMRGGNPVTFSTQTIKGIEYATFDAAAGAYSATYAADTTGPVITAVTAVPGVDGTATVTWTTDEPATSRVDYGTSAGSLTSFVSDGTLTTSHSVQLPGLAPDTTYHFRVTSADAVPNTTISPNPPDAPATFTMPTAVATDTTVAHFSAGTTGSSTYVSDTAGGEVILAPEVGAEFAGTTTPSGWSSGSWTGGSTTIGSGRATVDGSWIRADALGAAGRTVEFVGTFSGAAFQNAGFGVTLNGDPGESMALFGFNNASSVAAGPDLERVVHRCPARDAVHRFGASLSDRVGHVGCSLLHRRHARPHRYDHPDRHDAPDRQRLRQRRRRAVRRLDAGVAVRVAGDLPVAVHDAGSPADWGVLSYVADVPATTSLALSVRTGPTATPDGSWTSFLPISQGGDVTTSGRYLQYRVEAATSSAGVTPTLSSVTVPYNASTAPTVPDAPTAVSAVPGNTQAIVSWTAPTYDGGSPITGYEVTPYIGMTALTPVVFPSTATTQPMTGLTNGTSYVFTVRAINAIGSSAPSLASNAVTPATVPGAPTIGTAVAGAFEATVSWTAPVSNGGSPITGYAVTPYIGATAQTPVVFSSTTTTQTVTGLTIGTTYTFRVAAINGVGTGAQSAASNQVVPFGAATDTTVAHFTAPGTTGSSTYVSDTAGGEVILAPTVGAEFEGTTMPSGWTVNPWAGGGGANVTGGSVTVDQAAIWTNTFYPSGRALEFVANFSDPNQHIGFANDFNNGNWAIFSTGASGDQLYARGATSRAASTHPSARATSTACTGTGSSGRRRPPGT